MYKVLFKTQKEEDNAIVHKNIMALHVSNGDSITVSSIMDPNDFDMVIDVPKQQKEKALIFDHSGTIHRLGFPDEIEYNELPQDSDGLDQAERIKKEVERLEKLPKECPKCKHMKEPGMPLCPKCGFKPLGGEDVETDETRQIEKLKKKLEVGKEPTKEDKQEFWSMLKGFQRENIAKGKTYKDGFYSHKFKSKFGVWPKGLHDSPKPPSIEFRNWIKSQNIRNAKRRAK